jgi:hypothetical protein
LYDFQIDRFCRTLTVVNVADNLRLYDRSAAADELDEEYDKGDYQQDVDVCPNRVETDEPHQPED